MKISIGTPPVDTLVIVDTGSDLTWTQCDLSIETFRFASTSGKNVSIPDIAFGCGRSNGGMFSNATSGFIGLGRGNVSIVNQMHQEIKGKFSYCLIPFEISSTNPNAASHINFGDNAVVSSPGVVSTPLFTKDDPSGAFNLCYEPKENGTIDVPKIVAHFTNADLELSPTSVFAKVADDLVCLTIMASNDQNSIFGYLLQSSFLIGFDLVANTVSFKPTDCTYKH
ncbi:hypothetical protein BC332_20603 [Capsicum chinense]|nr:hypothetical protein BC332_20603 [Capsicum chinense]